MFGMMFTEHVASEYRDWANTDHELYDAIAIGMHARGAMPEPDSREPWFMCEAHGKGDTVDRVLVDLQRLARRSARGPRARRDRRAGRRRDVQVGGRLSGAGQERSIE